MKTLRHALPLALPLSACQQAAPAPACPPAPVATAPVDSLAATLAQAEETQKKLDALLSKVDDLEKKVEAGRAAAAARRATTSARPASP